MIFCMLFALPATFLLIAGICCWLESRKSCRWQSVAGKVTKSELKTRLVRTGDFGLARTLVYRPMVIYTYEVDGHTFRSARMSFVYENVQSKRCAEDALRNYPEDQEVTVYYDPEDPQDAVLDPKRSGLYGLAVCAFALTTLLCCIAADIFSLAVSC